MDLGGKVLGLGVSFAFTTFYHVFEDLHLDRFQGVYVPRPLPARMKINTEIREVRVWCHDPEYHLQRIDHTPKIEAWFADWFRSNGVARIGSVGASTSWCMRIKDIMESLESLYARGVTIYKTPNL